MWDSLFVCLCVVLKMLFWVSVCFFVWKNVCVVLVFGRVECCVMFVVNMLSICFVVICVFGFFGGWCKFVISMNGFYDVYCVVCVVVLVDVFVGLYYKEF